MHTLSMRFYDPTFQKLQKNAEQKQIPLSQYVRDLIEIGLRVEEAAAKRKNQDDNNEKLNASCDALSRDNLLWTLESLYLIRCLVHELIPETNEQYLIAAKEKAQELIDGLLKNDS